MVPPIGTLSRDDVIALAGRVGLHAPLATITRRSPTSVPPDMALSEVRRILQENGGLPVVVRSAEAALGVLGLEDISRIASLTDHLARGGVRRQVAESPETSGRSARYGTTTTRSIPGMRSVTTRTRPSESMSFPA